MVDPAHERIAAALQTLHDSPPASSRDFLLASDRALGELCQHLIGMEVALSPIAARRLPDGRVRVRKAMRLTRQLETTVRLVQQHLWGDSNAVRVPLEELQDRLIVLLPEHCREEAEVLRSLDEVLSEEERDQLAARWEDVTCKAPTRPHHHAWRRMSSTRLYYRVVGAWDRALDAMDSRTLPRRARPQPRPSLWGSYLLGGQLPRQETAKLDGAATAPARDASSGSQLTE
jgi:hypothetical protein